MALPRYNAPTTLSVSRSWIEAPSSARYNACVHEYEHRPVEIKLAPELIRAFSQAFIGRWDCYPFQLDNGKYTQIHEPLTQTHVFRHLTAFHVGMKPLTLGAYALNEQSQAQWLCFDADTDEQWREVVMLSSRLRSDGLPSYLERSRRGGHLWLFTPLLSGQHIRQFGQRLLALHHMSEYGSDGRKRLELYPKQDELKDGPGSFIRLPFGVHQKTQRIYPFVQEDGTFLAPTIRAQLALLAQPDRVPVNFIEAVLATQPIESPIPPVQPSPQFKKHRRSRREPLSEALKHRLSVFDFVSRYIPLDAHQRGLCPFHHDTVKSFQVNAEHNYWHCYAGCGGGSLIDFWMKWRSVHGEDGNFISAVKDLQKMLLR